MSLFGKGVWAKDAITASRAHARAYRSRREHGIS
jgi:hypothetical protein